MKRKQWLSLTLAVCVMIGATACGHSASSEYEVEIIEPERTSVPAQSQSQPSSTAQPGPTPQAGFVYGPVKDIEIVCSLADYSAPTVTDLQGREQLAFFKKNGKTGVINLDGKVIVPAEKDVHWCPVCGITNADESEIYNNRGEVVGSGGHGQTMSNVYYDEAAKKVYLEGEFGVLNGWNNDTLTTLEPMIVQVVSMKAAAEDDPEWKGFYLEDDQHPVKIGKPNEYRLFKPDGTALTDVVYEEIQRASTGMFAVKKNGLWGYVNQETGEQVVDFQYQQALPFNGDRAAVKTETGWGYISLTGKQKTSMAFQAAASAANESKAWVKTEQGWGVVDLGNYAP